MKVSDMDELDAWIRHGHELRRPLLVHPSLGKQKKICIVGGGLSGLTTAYRIAKKNPNISIELIERSSRLGGVIETWRQDDWVCDVAVNATRPHPAVWRLVRDLGLSDVFQPSKQQADSRWIQTRKRKHRLSRWTLLKMNPIKLLMGIRKARKGGSSVEVILPNKTIADAMTLGIVNDVSNAVDADFLMPAFTKFGDEPPISARKLRNKIEKTYPLFRPEPGSTASFHDGMSALVDGLVNSISAMSNVSIHLNHHAADAEEVCQAFGIDASAIIWSAGSPTMTKSKLSIFVAGYASKAIQNVPIGYGTLVPDASIPISGILHESDVHASSRAPDGHRLFRIMVPHARWDGNEESVRRALEALLTDAEPALFACIGERSIPKYGPGHLQGIARKSIKYTEIGWGVSGVSVTHVIDQAERISECF